MKKDLDKDKRIKSDLSVACERNAPHNSLENQFSGRWIIDTHARTHTERKERERNAVMHEGRTHKRGQILL